jgi:hypothetical protein
MSRWLREYMDTPASATLIRALRVAGALVVALAALFMFLVVIAVLRSAR